MPDTDIHTSCLCSVLSELSWIPYCLYTAVTLNLISVIYSVLVSLRTHVYTSPQALQGLAAS